MTIVEKMDNSILIIIAIIDIIFRPYQGKMKIKNCFLFGIIITFSLNCVDNAEQLYSTAFLRNYKAVRSYLRKEGFKKITFTTSDNLSLAGLFLSRPNAKYNIILCAGWRPGKKEGMATFYSLLPEDCNILFFDGRGRGDSEGPILKGLSRYGIHEYKDIVGAIEYINYINDLPVFLIGLCAGAFNAAHALIHLEKENKIETCGIKGLIFDSGWSSVTQTTCTSSIANVNKVILMFLKLLHNNKEQSENSYLYRLLSSCNSCCVTIIHKLCVKPIVAQYEHITNLTDKIHTITSSIFFIHSYEDELTPIEPVKQLFNLAKNKYCWWIKKSSHTMHHIIHKDLYKEKLATFINSTITATSGTRTI
jgi:hypothetical protein